MNMKKKDIHLLIIGDEILSGKILDKNTAQLATIVHKKGLSLNRVTILADETEKLAEIMRASLDNNELLVTSGGLGPTADDCTKQALAMAIGSELKASSEALQLVGRHYERRNKTYYPEQSHYHLLPEGITPVHNPVGLAPGLLLAEKILCLPGVPSEFAAMAKEHFDKHPEARARQTLTIRTYGLPEEALFKKIWPDFFQKFRHLGKAASLPHPWGVDIVLYLSEGVSEKQALKELKETKEFEEIAANIFAIGNTTPEEALVNKARELKLKLATAESCTGGNVAKLISSVPGASAVFEGSIVSYSERVKKNQLEVHLQEDGQVSAHCAVAMAKGVAKALQVDLAVSTTGVTGPDSLEGKSPGTVYFGLYCRGQTRAVPYQRSIHGRIQAQETFSTLAILMLLKELQQIERRDL